MRSVLLLLVALTACRPSLHDRAATTFRTHDATGAAVVLDVATGREVIAIGVGRDVSARVLPLSTIKLYVAALWYQHGFGDGSFPDPRHGRVTIHDVVVFGYDAAGAAAAVELRTRFGADTILRELRAYGLTALTLAPDADDVAWGRTLSIGEQHVTVTLRDVAAFLRTPAARTLDVDLRGAVERGTAKSIAARLAGTTWAIGGKTGTGPNVVGPTSDGWFAGVIYEGTTPRYTFAIYVDHRGPGGGVAAAIAADLVAALRDSHGGSHSAPTELPAKDVASTGTHDASCSPRIMTRQYGSPAAGGHAGVDFAMCDTEKIVAIADGEVVAVASGQDDDDRGGLIAMTHKIDGWTVLFLYAHVANIQVVDGQRVNRGRVLGDGWTPSSPQKRIKWRRHVHLEIVNQIWDPLKLLGGCESKGVVARPIYPVSC